MGNLFRFLIIVSLIFFSDNFVDARNFNYEGHDIILDQPEGELRIYDVKVVSQYYNNSDNKLSHPDTTELKVPFIFTPDNKAYVLNLIGNMYLSVCGAIATWTEGEYDERSITFKPKSLYGFDFETAVVYPDYNPLYTYKSVYIDFENKEIKSIDEMDNNGLVKDIILYKQGNKYISNFQENYGVRGRTDYIIITSIECTPSDFKPVEPPAGYAEEDYQINFVPVNSSDDDKASLRIKAVKTANEIYFKGLSVLAGGNPEAWIKGEIQGDKVKFLPTDPFNIGRDGKEMYITPMVEDKEMRQYVPIYQDLMFDYDHTTGNLTNPSAYFGFTDSPDEKFSNQYSMNGPYHTGYSDNLDELFKYAEIIKVPKDYKFEPLSTKGDKINYLDKNGYMMNPDNIFVRFYDEDDNFLPVEYYNFESWSYETTDLIPFSYIYFSNKYGIGGIGVKISNFQRAWISENYRGEVFYLEDGQEPDAGVERLETSLPHLSSTTKIYDLYGRRYERAEGLAPGLYIIDGKKVLKK